MKYSKKFGFAKRFFVLMALFLIAWSISAGDAEAARKAFLKKKKMTITVGGSKKIVIRNKSSKKKYTFKSSKKSVAKVNRTGKVTGVKSGKAKIKVFESSKKKSKKKRRRLRR